MAPVTRNDEQIRVGTTVGLTAGSSSFVFDGSGGKPDYRFFEPVFSEVTGRGILIKGLDYSWDYTTATFALLQAGDKLKDLQYYNVHFQGIAQNTPATPSSLIDVSFFIRDINLTNTNLSPTIERINLFIAKYEPKCLSSILGYSLYKALLNESSQRITNLINGCEYTDCNGNLQQWQGLVHDTNISLIANYVYYYFQQTSATQTTGISTGAMKTESGISTSPVIKMVDAWNFFSSEVKAMSFFLWNQNNTIGLTALYPEFSSHQYLVTKELSRPINEFGI